MISISSFQPGQATAVAELITNIQQKEFGVPITLADQPDLLDINGFYFQKNGHFWCAIDGQGEVIGTIALLNSGDGHGTIRKMFVRKDFRGKAHNIAKPLLDTLEQWAMANGITHLSLGTREDLAAARHFYLKNAYQVIAAPDLPALFPRMAVDNLFFQKKLQKPDPLLEAVSIERCTDAPTFLECATMMAATPPWQTRGLAYCLDAVNGDFKETYILRDGSELLGFAVLQMSGAFSGSFSPPSHPGSRLAH